MKKLMTITEVKNWIASEKQIIVQLFQIGAITSNTMLEKFHMLDDKKKTMIGIIKN